MNTTLLKPLRRGQPLVVTFYSFKGGVGRTLTLVNAAFALAARGKNVILIDFDLEAPGLDAFPLLEPPQPGPGLLEYIEIYIRTGTPPDLRRFVTKTYETPGEGSIHVMYAGCFDESYPERLGRINWNDFYAKNDGYFFLENLKDELREKFSPDYVLIDSRTGQADVAGIATVHLPDVVVLMYALDQQNLRGAARMAEAIRNNAIGKSIKVLPVASRVPMAADYSDLQQGRLADADKRGIPPTVVLPSESSLAFGEAVLTRTGDAPRLQVLRSLSPLQGKVEELVDEIIRSNAGDADNFLQDARAAFAHGNRERVWELFSSASRSFASPRTWLEFGTFLMGTGKHDDAVKALNIAKELAPGWSEPFIKLAQADVSLRNLHEAVLYANQYIRGGGRRFDEVFTVAHGLFRAGVLEDAEALLRWCEDSDDINLRKQVNHDRCLVLIAQNRLREALELIEAVFSTDPQQSRDVTWLYNYAEALRRTGRPEANETFERFLTVAAAHHEALALAIRSSGLHIGAINAPRADLAQVPAYSLVMPSQANFVQASAHALAVLGQKDKARSYFTLAIRLVQDTPQNEVIFSTLSYRWESPTNFIADTRKLMKEDIGEQTQDSSNLFSEK